MKSAIGLRGSNCGQSTQREITSKNDRNNASRRVFSTAATRPLLPVGAARGYVMSSDRLLMADGAIEYFNWITS
jgi:hypothetical protein